MYDRMVIVRLCLSINSEFNVPYNPILQSSGSELMFLRLSLRQQQRLQCNISHIFRYLKLLYHIVGRVNPHILGSPAKRYGTARFSSYEK